MFTKSEHSAVLFVNASCLIKAAEIERLASLSIFFFFSLQTHHRHLRSVFNLSTTFVAFPYSFLFKSQKAN
jgi:hypothetical protein